MQTKAADEKFCSECASAIKAKAIVCPKCGCPQGPQRLATTGGESQGKNKNTAGILALILGGLGAHKFYLSRPGMGILYMGLFLFFCVSVVLALIDAIRLFGMSEQAFDAEYNSGTG